MQIFGKKLQKKNILSVKILFRSLQTWTVDLIFPLPIDHSTENKIHKLSFISMDGAEKIRWCSVCCLQEGQPLFLSIISWSVLKHFFRVFETSSVCFFFCNRFFNLEQTLRTWIVSKTALLTCRITNIHMTNSHLTIQALV